MIAFTLNASNIELLQKINTTYEDDFYAHLSNNSAIFLSDYENNATQKKIKDDFEEILPLYLKSSDIFSKSSLKLLENKEIKFFKIRAFIPISVNYVKYLESIKEKELATEIMKKNLLTLHDLMVNSKGIINYVIALSSYLDIYSNYKNPSSSILSLLQENPPPHKSIYIQKVEDEKMITFGMIDAMTDEDEKSMKDYNTSAYKELMTKVKSSTKLYINEYTSKRLIATLSESEQKREEFEQYLQEEEKSAMSIWTLIKLFFHKFLANILQIFIGYNTQYDYVAEYMAKVLALTAQPKTDTMYDDHVKLEHEYERLVQMKGKE